MNILTVTNKIKWPLAKIVSLFRNIRGGRLYPMVISKWEGIIIWLIVFVISEIIISGGRYDQNYFLLAVNLIIILIISLYFSVKRPIKAIWEALLRGVVAVLAFAVLDFLVIDLFLLKNNLGIYKNWQTYVIYGLVLLIPIIASRFGKKRFTSPEELEKAIGQTSP